MSGASSGVNPPLPNTYDSTSNRVESVIEITGIPTLRIGLLGGYKRLDYHLCGAYNIYDLKGKCILSNVCSDLKWRSKIEKSNPAKFSYHILLKTFGNYEAANYCADTLVSRGYPAYVLEIGSIIKIDGKVIYDNRKYRLIIGNYQTEAECQPYLNEFSDEYAPRIVRKLVEASFGKVEFYDAEFDFSGSVDQGFRLVPQSDDAKVLIHKVQVGKGFHWEDTEDREYSGIIEIRIDHEGLLEAINEVPIDVYLKGVVPAEMPANYPYEALRAQAVAARSEVMSKLGTKHLFEHYDFCANVHCQVYAGITKNTANSDSAVKSTTGEVLTYNGEICDAVYSAVCGGHTENKENVWNSPPEDYLQGIYDHQGGNSFPFKLDDERDFRKWIDSNIPVFCNVGVYNVPPVLNGAVNYFRWEESYTRQELEAVVKQKTGIDVGTIYGIELLKRGVSGRLYEIEILGSRRNLKIKNELNIRRSLSKTHLKSSAFYLQMRLDDDGVPQEFIFKGAGWGHGVGMCQVGAAVMAHLGSDYQAILAHYYTGCEIKRIYTISGRENQRKDYKPKLELVED